MTANTATFYAAPSYRDQPASPAGEKPYELLARFVEHMFSGGAPIWHVATIGAVMSQTNSTKR